MNPKYSVIMTSFNYAAYIGAAIESVLAQTCQDWELLIVDDRSTDESWEIIQQFQDPRIQCYLQPVNLGACDAYNFALSKARGQYIASLDSDDVFMPCKLERQLAFFERHPEVGICGVFVSEIDHAGSPLTGATPHADWFNVGLDLNDPAYWIWTNHLCHSGAVVRADLHRALGPFNSRLVFTPDWEFWLRALTAGARFAVIPEPLVAYRNHGGNITQKTEGNARLLQEHARTASEWLMPWLMRESRFDLMLTLIEGFATRVAGQPAVEVTTARELTGGTGAALAMTTALRMIRDQRASILGAETLRLQLVAGQEELQNRLVACEKREVELAEVRELESTARFRLEAVAQDSLASANAQREHEKSIEAEKEKIWELELDSLRRLEAEARDFGAVVLARREVDKLAEAEKEQTWALKLDSLSRSEAEARGSLVAVMAQREADKLAEAEKHDQWMVERTFWYQSDAEVRASLAAAIVGMEEQQLSAAEKDKKVVVERATWRRLLAEAREFLTAAELSSVKKDQSFSRGGLGSVWAKVFKTPVSIAPNNSDTTFIRSKVSADGQVDVFLTDLHGASFVAQDHKTLLVLHELSRTGAPRVVLYLAQAIRQITGVTPLIWAPVDGDIRAEFEADGFPVIVDPSIMDYQPVHTTPRRAVSGFDQVIVTSIAAYQFVRHYGSVANKLRWWIHEEAAGFEYVTTELAPDLALLFERCEAIWLGSPLCFAPAGQHAAHHKLFLLLYGCEDTSRPAVPNPDGRMVIAIVGSLDPRKGQDIFMDAIEMLPSEQRDGVLFRFIGSATDWYASFEASLHSRAAAFPHIEFIPNVPPEKLNDLYASSDVIVSASRSDPMPISITQGLMFSKVCVCSSVIGHAALLQDQNNALIFESENALQLAEKLTWVIANPQAAAKIGKNGRHVYETNFLESQFVANVENLLKVQGL